MPLSISNAADRIPRGMVGQYCRKVREIAKQYEDKIRIKCGIEIDFHPSVISEVERVLDAGDFDFILASSHMHVFIKDYPRYSFNDFAALALENSVKAVEYGRFNAISHPDMYRWVFENPERFPLQNDGYNMLKHKDLINELLDKVAKSGMYIEINPHFAEAKQDVAYTASGKTPVSWNFTTMPSEAWKNEVGTALTLYAADQTDANWDAVVTAFVDGWASEYALLG